MAAWRPSGSRTMTSGSVPRRRRMTSTRRPRRGWCGWVMVTNPEGGGDEGVVCFGHSNVVGQAAAKGHAFHPGSILRNAVQPELARIPAGERVPHGTEGHLRCLERHQMVHRG